ncbi:MULTISPECIES: DUF2670 domain-containing protein [unclassified Candidatus Tisiphia]|jgi:hypothetical protein|uniref:DUF2670 domain-containing protein n=1 Tax=unclassified Candidatus Tisiphia TaxID=2996318 RepID=UPI001E7F58B6|nr:MAG: DUF2670 domain-containing protein [Rickettsia endosymbiont of Cimex lectularius]
MWQALRRLIAANPMGMFLWSIIAKWYFMIAVASLIVLFWVAKGLEQIGFIKYMTDATIEILDTSKSIAQNCTTKLGPNFESLTNFWKCLGDPPKYEIREEETGEKVLEDGLNKLLPKDKTVPEMLPYRNPYDSPNDSTDSDGK